MKHLLAGLIAITFLAFLSACAPEVGSKAWCAKMQEKPKGDWTVNEATDYAKSCLLR